VTRLSDITGPIVDDLDDFIADFVAASAVGDSSSAGEAIDKIAALALLTAGAMRGLSAKDTAMKLIDTVCRMAEHDPRH
jgi:hypothetical protein